MTNRCQSLDCERFVRAGKLYCPPCENYQRQLQERDEQLKMAEIAYDRYARQPAWYRFLFRPVPFAQIIRRPK
jgi:uncharacterized Zn finger protein (UPF0148 family)